LFQTYVDTDIEWQDAEVLMPAKDQDFFEDDVDDEHVLHDEIADELEEEFVEDDRISSNQQVLQELNLKLLKIAVTKMSVECRIKITENFLRAYRRS